MSATDDREVGHPAATQDAVDSFDGDQPETTGNSAPKVGSWFDGRYEIRRLLGQGAAGAVYLARDIELGRRVALKVLRANRTTSGAGERLAEEARTLSRVKDPHVITLYDLRISQGQRYLSLEYLEGGSLRRRLAAGPIGAYDAIRYGLAVARGLAAVHASGLLHRDLKPSNILFAVDGRPKVADFGLALLTGRRSGRAQIAGRSGTYVYMAPEQWTGGEVGPAMDLWALGCVLFEMVVGRRPFSAYEPTSGEGYEALGRIVVQPKVAIPDAAALRPVPRLRSLIHQLLDRDPTLRPTAIEAAQALEAILHPVRTLLADRSPFVGLSSFGLDEADFFFGRSADISSVIERLRNQPVLVLHGRSGVGKSSLIRAGVLPRMKMGARPWEAIVTRPGRTGLLGLAADALQLEPDHDRAPAAALAEELRDNPHALSRTLFKRARAQNQRLVLFVDQFEEVITHASDDPEWQAYAKAVVMAADDPSDPIRVVASIRDDFLSRFDSLAEVARAIGKGYLLGPPDEHALLESLTRPVSLVGFRFDEATLPATMVTAVRGEPSALPLLQFTATRLWELRDSASKSLLASAYRTMGGVEGALVQHANRLIDGQSTENLAAIRGIVIGLVSEERTRLVRPMAEVLHGLGPQGPVQLERLIDSRLVVSARHEGGSVELVHESLIHRWDWLANELDASAEERGFLLRLDTAAKAWDGGGRQRRFAWDADPVEDAKRWGLDLKSGVGPVTAAFVAASQARVARRRRSQMAFAILSVLAVLASFAWVAASAQLGAAAANRGEFQLRLQPFDWTDRTYTTSPVSAGELPNLGIRLYRASDEYATVPGVALDGDLVDIDETSPGEFRISAPGYPTILEVYGRNRVGQTCSSSWIRLQDLPGYDDTESGAVPEFEIPVPTCDASRVGMAHVPAGLAYIPPADADGDREPFGAPIRVEGFWMDEFEITNRKYSVMLPTGNVTGVTDMPKGIFAAKPDPTGADMPRSWVNYFEAANYCRFLGKRLPTRAEFVRAARGSTRRSCSADVPECWVACNVRPPPEFNEVQMIAQPKEFYSVEPGAFLNCEGPFGHYDLTGNVGEWSADLYIANLTFAHYLGSESYLPFQPWESGVSYPNVRAVGFKAASSGFRCVSN